MSYSCPPDPRTAPHQPVLPPATVIADHAGLAEDKVDTVPNDARTSDNADFLPLPPCTSESVLQLGSSPWLRHRQNLEATARPAGRGLTGVLGNGPRRGLRSVPPVLPAYVRSVEEKAEETLAWTAQRMRAVQDEKALTARSALNLRRARWYFCVGCFGLPLLHFVSAVYFARELKGHDADFHIKRYIYLSLIVATIETLIWVLWVVVYYLLSDDQLRAFNILNSNITNFSLI